MPSSAARSSKSPRVLLPYDPTVSTMSPIAGLNCDGKVLLAAASCGRRRFMMFSVTSRLRRSSSAAAASAVLASGGFAATAGGAAGACFSALSLSISFCCLSSCSCICLSCFRMASSSRRSSSLCARTPRGSAATPSARTAIAIPTRLDTFPIGSSSRTSRTPRRQEPARGGARADPGDSVDWNGGGRRRGPTGPRGPVRVGGGDPRRQRRRDGDDDRRGCRDHGHHDRRRMVRRDAGGAGPRRPEVAMRVRARGDGYGQQRYHQ